MAIPSDVVAGNDGAKKKAKDTSVDGGWGWMCVMGGFVLHIFIMGLTESFAILYMGLRERFDSSSLLAAWVGGTNTAIRMMCSEYPSIITKYCYI